MTGRASAAAWILAAAAVLAGCSSIGGCGGTDLVEARAALEDVLGELPAGTRVLAYEPGGPAAPDRPATGAGWIVLSPGPLPAPATAGSAEAPVAAVLTAAAAMGADPAGVGAPTGPAGTLREWAAPAGPVRVRSVETDRGVLSHVEAFPAEMPGG